MVTKSHHKNHINTTNFISTIAISLKEKLPGAISQFKMAPFSRKEELQKQKIPNNAIEAAVLLCLCIDNTNNSITIPFIKRCEYNGVHSGQIALPGGKKEINDKNLIETAIRETQEEIGIYSSAINILGCLTPLYIPPSNYIVTPVVAFSDKTINYCINSNEVTELIQINLFDLLNPLNVNDCNITINNKTILAPAFLINNYCIWGATAMIINEFLDIIRLNKLL